MFLGTGLPFLHWGCNIGGQKGPHVEVQVCGKTEAGQGWGFARRDAAAASWGNAKVCRCHRSRGVRHRLQCIFPQRCHLKTEPDGKVAVLPGGGKWGWGGDCPRLLPSKDGSVCNSWGGELPSSTNLFPTGSLLFSGNASNHIRRLTLFPWLLLASWPWSRQLFWSRQQQQQQWFFRRHCTFKQPRRCFFRQQVNLWQV